MTALAGAALIAAGCALAYRASVVETDPGWRTDTAGVLLGLGGLAWIYSVFAWIAS